MKKVLRLVFVNLAVFIGLVLLINLAAVIAFRSYRLLKPDNDPRSTLPNYDTVKWAAMHFTEFSRLPAVYRSYTGWRRLPFSGQTIKIDENGIRATSNSLKQRDSARLAVFLGGSALWGTGSDDGNTIPSHFSNSASGEYRSLNYGESGYNAFQGYLFLKLAVMKGLNPDLVVCYEGANEIDALLKRNRPISHSRENQISSALRGADRDEVLSLKHYFIEPVIVFTGKIKARNQKVTEADYDLSPERLEIVALNFLKSWESVMQLTQQNNGKFIGVLQPVAYRGSPAKDHIMLDETRGKAFGLFYSKVIDLLKKPEFSRLAQYVIDPFDAFDSKEYIYIDDVHVSPEGNRIIAGLVYDFQGK